MNFVSIEFIIFFVVSLLLKSIFQKFFNKQINLLFLLIINYLFYAYWDYRFCLLLIFTSSVSYFCGKNINNKAYLYIGIIVPITILCIFKYLNFFLDSFNFETLNIILPIGISFYTFEAISYVIDCYIHKIEPEKNFLVFATYISFFPNIISGPIERAGYLLKQIKDNKGISSTSIEQGIQIMAIGYFKKMVIADRINIFVSNIYDAPNAYSSLTILLAVLSYSIQIYMDFSGYSDIAIGCAKCFGYDLKRNFNLPYISKSVTEFWRRWHISLSSWFKDYVYIPLGGNRRGIIRQYINLIIVMTLSGLWHGSNWNYVLWGLINGIILCIEKPFIKQTKNKRIIDLLKIIGTYILVSFTWIFFRSESLGKAIQIINNLLAFKDGINQMYIWSLIGILFIALIEVYISINNHELNGYYPIQNLSTIKGLTIFFVFVGLILCLAYANTNPFVYFQF